MNNHTIPDNTTRSDDVITDMSDPVGYDNVFDVLHVRILLICAYLVVFIFGVIGNFLVVLVIVKHRRMRSVTNFFLANLAVADFSVGIFCVLPNLSLNLTLHWLFGKIMCKLYFFIQAMSYTASILILTAISIERYFAITHPLKTKQFTTVFRLAIIVVVIWVMAAVYSGPMLVVYDVFTIKETGESFCLMVYDMNMKAYVTANFLLCYLLPLAVISILYIRISIVLWRSSNFNNLEKQAECKKESKSCLATIKACCKRKPKNNHASNSLNLKPINEEQSTTESALLSTQTSASVNGNGIGNHILPNCTKSRGSSPANRGTNGRPTRNTNSRKQDLDVTVKQREKKQRDNVLMGRRRVIRLLLAVVASFTACVLPYHVRILRQYWTNHQDQSISFEERLFSPISFIFYYLNSALNPVLYAFLSVNFRRSLKELLTCDRSTNMAMSMRSGTYAHTGGQSAKTTQSTV